MNKPIEVFKRGTQTDSVGTKISFDDATLEAIATNYNAKVAELGDTAKAPIVVGHPTVDAPAYGWLASMAYNKDTGILTAEPERVNPEFAELVNKGTYPKKSMSFFAPGSTANPCPGSYFPRHLGQLGGAAPAIAGLQVTQFAADDQPVEFSDWDDAVSAGMFRSIRDWIISRFGMEDADKAIPGYAVATLQESAAIELAKADGEGTPDFSAAAAEPEAVAEPAIVDASAATTTKQESSDYTEREAALAAREAAFAAREQELATAEFNSFCEDLSRTGRLNGDEQHVRAAAIFTSLQGAGTVDFAEEGAVSASKLFKDFLAGLPVSVSFSEVSRPEDAPTLDAVDFVAPHGSQVDQAGLALQAKAQAYMKQHPGVSLMDAIKQINPL